MGILGMTRLAGAWFAARLNVKSERGATAVEYGIMVALIAAVIIIAVLFLADRQARLSAAPQARSKTLRRTADARIATRIRRGSRATGGLGLPTHRRGLMSSVQWPLRP